MTGPREWLIATGDRANPASSGPRRPSHAPVSTSPELLRQHERNSAYDSGYRSGRLDAWALAFPVGGIAAALVIDLGSRLLAGLA